MTVTEYPAIRIRQTEDGPALVLFGAPAVDIAEWAGIPQKKQLGSSETTGFQREVNKRRLKQLKEFYSDGRNIVQNPLLCATRSDTGSVEFVGSGDGPVEIGTLKIRVDALNELPLVKLLSMVKSHLERRVEALAGRAVDPELLNSLRRQAAEAGHAVELPEDDDDVGDDDEDNDSEGGADLTSVIEDESHILDFYDEVAGRAALLEELGDAFKDEGLLGYTREAMISYLKPVIVVDGQHRLEGAIAAAAQLANEDEALQQQAADLIDGGMDPDEAWESIRRGEARQLPVSLLLTDSPAEHVFQFVIVNQKATPIGRPLLGTIISTTLSNDELKGVSNRLEKAGIALQDSRAIASLSRDPNSPFVDLVQKGLSEESGSELLAWSVFGSLVRIFRELRGGKLFGERNDYADKWRRDYLAKSEILGDYERLGFDSPEAYWSEISGPWRGVFIAFWTEVRNFFASTDDPDANNYWGQPRQSNLFNKISLTILAADFFQFLCETRQGIDSVEHVHELVADWLHGINSSYFSRDWELAGVKKDSTGIRNQWAKLWTEYRKDPNRLPRTENYRKSLNPG